MDWITCSHCGKRLQWSRGFARFCLGWCMGACVRYPIRCVLLAFGASVQYFETHGSLNKLSPYAASARPT